jgi:hypothetical protein
MSVATWRDLAVQELRLSVGRGASDAPGSVTLTTLVVESGITP